MSKTRAPRERSEKKRFPDGDPVEVIWRVPKGARLPRGPRRLEGSARESRPRFSRGLTVEYSPRPFWERLAEKRKTSDPQSEFSKTWDEFITRQEQMRDRLHNLKRVCSSDVFNQVIQLAEIASTAETCRQRLLNRFGGIGDMATLGLEWGLDKFRGLDAVKDGKAPSMVELEHKVALLRIDEPDAKALVIAGYLLRETEADGDRCHDCQRCERAVTGTRRPLPQRCELYRHSARCQPCDVCRAWHMRLSDWLQKRSTKWDEDDSGQRIEVKPGVREERNKDALRKRIERISG